MYLAKMLDFLDNVLYLVFFSEYGWEHTFQSMHVSSPSSHHTEPEFTSTERLQGIHRSPGVVQYSFNGAAESLSGLAQCL